MSDPWLLLETSGRGGTVGLASGDALTTRVLDPGRRHNRDLVPVMLELLGGACLTPRDLQGVMVSMGPGSFTGLRVGVMSAKVLAYATGCRLVPVPTFAILAEQVEPATGTLDVIADGLQGLVYAQRYVEAGGRWVAANDLHLTPAATWAATLPGGGAVTGPGVELFDALVPAETTRIAAELRRPGVAKMPAAGWGIPPVGREKLMALEPLYLRPSSAEEQAARKRGG